jgi:hypothetical protein
LYLSSGTAFTGTPISSQPYYPEPTDLDAQYYIATLDIESYDLADQDALILLADVISRFEIIAIQNVQPGTAESALQDLIEFIDVHGHRYDFIIDSFISDAKPRLAYIYRTDIVYPVQWYSNSGSWISKPEQDPFVVRFENNDGEFDFTLINYNGYQEPRSSSYDSLSLLVNDVKENFTDELDIIILGPTGADCGRPSPGDALLLLNNENYICLVDHHNSEDESNGTPPYPQIIIASYSEDLFWEEGEMLAIEETSAYENLQAGTLIDQPGFSGVIVVKSGDEVNNDSKSKGSCFFKSTFN